MLKQCIHIALQNYKKIRTLQKKCGIFITFAATFRYSVESPSKK